MRIAENNEFVMGKVTRFYDAIEESNFGLELCPNIFGDIVKSCVSERGASEFTVSI